ncbi:MAG: TorF family putative porin [Pseudomonadota bacterium]|nr:TorF family putative porin [Pseudomonadota bacterium]
MIRNTPPARLVLAATFAAVAAPVLAQSSDPSSGPSSSWSFEVGAGTDNRSKAASKSGNNGYVSAYAAWESADGLIYVSPGFQTIQAGGSNIETDWIVGYRPEAFGYAFDLNVAYKHRLDVEAGYDADGLELSAVVSRAVGPAQAALLVQYAPDAPGSTRSYVWVEAELGWAFTPRLEGSGALGRREQDNGPDYTGWNVGVTYALTDALDLDLRYHDTDAHTFGEQYEDALVAQVAYAF